MPGITTENPSDKLEAIIRRNKSPGYCSKCCLDYWDDEEWGHKPKNCRNIKYCCFHGVEGHIPTLKCAQFCINCKNRGHSMHHCYKLKNCNLCGKVGHSPYRCWEYFRISMWLRKASEDDRCVDCLHPWKESRDHTRCSNCHGKRAKDYFPSQSPQETRESQMNDYTVQETQAELQQEKAIIEDQRLQIEELSNKISALEIQLKSSIETITELNSQLQNTLKEKEQELQKVNTFDSLVKEKEMELRKLQEQIKQKDLELERHRQTSAQSSQSIPAAAQQPCPTLYNRSEYINETNGINATLKDLQDQQQKLSVVVNYICNKIRTQDMYWHNQTSFNPYLGPYDTGQYFNKVQQV